jgi:hypothetical protein
MQTSRLKVFFAIGSLLLMAFLIVGCQTAEPAAPVVEKVVETVVETVIEYVEVTVVVEPTPAPTEVPPEPPPPPDHSAYTAAWEGSPHGGGWDPGKGPNTWCSRCHSPQNWDPEAFQGPPPSCFTCKFAHEEEFRVAEGNPLVPEEDWVGIGCETCHVMDDGVVTEGIAWLNPVKMEYETVNTPTELCQKCHVTTTGNAFGSGVDHLITLGGSAHLNYGGFLGEDSPPTYCTDCHDPHSQEPKQCGDCHTIDEAGHAKGKYAYMAATVTCMACHEASGLDVGPHPDEDMGGVWVPTLTEMGRAGPSTTAVISHSIVYTVACDRCHFDENPWELTVYDADGEIPEPEDAGG